MYQRERITQHRKQRGKHPLVAALHCVPLRNGVYDRQCPCLDCSGCTSHRLPVVRKTTELKDTKCFIAEHRCYLCRIFKLRFAPYPFKRQPTNEPERSGQCVQPQFLPEP